MEIPKVLKITKVKKESKTVSTLFLNHKIDYQPGQFIMLWLPGIDEKPFALSYHSKDQIGITVEAKGECTKKLITLKPGDKLGIRGPYGKPFSIKKGKSIVVAGGLGMASVATLIEELNNPIIINGARTRELLLYKDRFKNARFCTDDGSFGFKGFTTEVLENELKNKKIDFIYACGPEVMMKKVMELGLKHSIQGELSLERFMACGYGICAQCMVDDRLVCKDGPVFSFKEAKNMKEFGAFAYTPSGRKATLKEYYSH